ncbi:uncharacterized protein N7446_004243, partial [Penicillium canescens]
EDDDVVPDNGDPAIGQSDTARVSADLDSSPSFTSVKHHGRISEPSIVLRGICDNHSPSCRYFPPIRGDLMPQELPLPSSRNMR